MVKIGYLFVILLIAGNDLFAQNLLKGKVTDTNGEPLVGVSVMIHENESGTSTQADGSYQLALPANLNNIDVEFSMVGYRSKLESVSLTGSNYVLDIILTESRIEMQKITVTAGFAKEKELLPYSIASLSKKEVVSSGSMNLSQVISKTPGVYSSSFGNGVGKPVIRGLTNTNIVLLNNGIKQENFNFSSNHPFLVDEFSADRVEIIKGATSLQYGSDAVGGVVNVVRERPAQPQSIVADFTSHYNTNTNGYLNSLGIKGGGKTFFYGLRGSLKSHEDFTDGNDNTVTNTRFNETNFSANAGARTDRGIFSINYNYTRPKYGLQNPKQINLFNTRPDLLTSGRENQVWFQNLESHLISSNSSIFLGKSFIEVDLAYQMNSRNGIGGGFNPQQQQVVIPTRASMQLNTFTYNAKIVIPGDDRKLIFGVNGANIRNDADETAPNNPLLDSEINDVGVYGIGDFNLSEKLTLTSGLRYDFRNMKSFPSPTQTTNRFEIDNTYHNLNGSLGITYRFADLQSLKANIARGFRSPSMPELTQNGIHSQRFESGNPDLNPQRNMQFDVNYHLHTSWVNLDVSSFFNIVNNFIYLIRTIEDAPIGDGKIFQHVQNDVTLIGGEAALDIHPTRWLGLYGSYSLVRSEITDDPGGFEYPTFIPQDRLTGEIKLENENLGFMKLPYIALEVMHFLEQNRTGQNESASPAYTLLNARVGAGISIGMIDNMDIFIHGNNLADTAYIDHLSVTKRLGLNMMGRNFMFGMRLPLDFTL
jgi:iron complex outermembrane recepter protein